ncbi:hypothetical protein HanIR_Chr10g0451231 [Helianthus annuus]|nr:hypothetical protein HanIR_Chr10g0451231 [Helianthus annuus]
MGSHRSGVLIQASKRRFYWVLSTLPCGIYGKKEMREFSKVLSVRLKLYLRRSCQLSSVGSRTGRRSMWISDPINSFV